MSDDLISRQHLLNRIRYYVSHTNNGSPENYAYNIALNEIIQAPKAFDKEKVIEELKEEGCIVDDDAGNRAVEIIEKGGIE